MKKSKIFATVVYFLFTFGMGVIFSLTLPGYFATFTVPAELIGNALAANDFVTCLVLTEPVGFYREPVLDRTFENGGGIILYETVMEVDGNSAQTDGESADKPLRGTLYKCYTGYVYGVADRYEVFSAERNGTALKVTTAEGNEIVLPILDYDADGDGRYDGISTFDQNGFIVLELGEDDVASIKRLSFTDRTGATVLVAEAERELRFESVFFDCFGDMESYNDLVAEGAKGGISAEETARINGARNDYVASVVTALENAQGCELTPESAEYKAATEAVGKQANRKAIPFIIIYFVFIYIIADFLLGTHFIIKFFSWFLFKVCKIPHKGKAPPEKKDAFGHDFYSMVTLRLDVTEVPEFNGSVEVRYSADGEEFAFSLLKADGYTATLRMKAGVYVNPFIDIDREYAPVDLPDNLEVDGYQTEITIKIVRREVHL